MSLSSYEEYDPNTANLCTCAKCNTDIDCASIAAESRTKSDYDKAVRAARRGKKMRLAKSEIFHKYANVFKDIMMAHFAVDAGMRFDFPHGFECSRALIDRNDMKDEIYIVMVDDIGGKFVRHTIHIAELSYSRVAYPAMADFLYRYSEKRQTQVRTSRAGISEIIHDDPLAKVANSMTRLSKAVRAQRIDDAIADGLLSDIPIMSPL